MINIDLTPEMVRGEPGPNLFWYGPPSDYLSLVRDLHDLGVANGKVLDFGALSYIHNETGKSFIASSLSDARSLVAVNDHEVNFELDRRLWQEVLYKVLSISFCPGFQYIEFDDLDLREDANWIVESRLS